MLGLHAAVVDLGPVIEGRYAITDAECHGAVQAGWLLTRRVDCREPDRGSLVTFQKAKHRCVEELRLNPLVARRADDQDLGEKNRPLGAVEQLDLHDAVPRSCHGANRIQEMSCDEVSYGWAMSRWSSFLEFGGSSSPAFAPGESDLDDVAPVYVARS